MPDEPPLSSSGGASPATNRKVVVFGGGTGISAALEGIKESGSEVTAIVTVADDGGSSGRLRKDYHMLPPGDIRNCLVALSDGDPLLGELFNYRFEDSILKGHSFGNLFLAVLTRLTGDFRAAVDRARGLRGVTNRVIPSTSTRVVLVARHPDGTRSTGEQCISRGGKPISGMELKPQPPSISDEIKGVIAEADLLVLGPGSLFTSLVPNLLVPGMPEALAEARRAGYVRLRIDGALYDLRAERVTDAVEIASFGKVWARQSMFLRDPAQFEEVWLYRMAPR